MRKIRLIFGAALLMAALVAAATPAHADQDAVQFFHEITATPDTPVHDAVCFFCSVRVDGSATGDIVVFFGNVHINGIAEHDVVDFFGNITATDNSRIQHDTVSMFGNIRLGENASVGHDMVAVFGSVRASSPVRVGGDHVTISGWILYGPLLLIIALIFVLRERRVHRMRMGTRGYPYPPRP